MCAAEIHLIIKTLGGCSLPKYSVFTKPKLVIFKFLHAIFIYRKLVHYNDLKDRKPAMLCNAFISKLILELI